MPSLNNSFPGIGQGFTGPQGTFAVTVAPSDSNGAVGPQDFVETVNTDFAVFNKDSSRGAVGTVRYGPVQINTLWSGFGGLCQADNDGDPTVIYDSIANRWLITQFAVTNPNPNFYQCIAVSTGSDPTGSYYRYAFAFPDFPDYPKFGLWPDAYYASFNMFDPSTMGFLGGEVCALNRASMLSGANAASVCTNPDPNNFASMLPSTLDGSRLPPAGSPNYMLEIWNTSSLALWKFHVDWTTPANSTVTGPTLIPVASFTLPCGQTSCDAVPQVGTSQLLDTLGDRLMYRLAYRNFGSYESLVVDHTVTAGSSVGMRWYEIRSPGGTPTVFQSGTYAPDSSYRWMGSIAQDQSGDMAMGFSISSSSTHPGISYTGRLASDPLGSMAQGEASVLVGGGSQTTGLDRWGDYTSMAVDPTDDCTFWYTDQYIPSNGTFNWKTQIASFKFSSCGTPDFSINANPANLVIAPGSSDTSTISTAVTNGSAGTVSLAASISPAGPTVSLNPTSVTAGNSSTLTVNVGSGVPNGTYTVTVTGTEGSAVHSTSVQVIVAKLSKTWYFAEGYTGSSFTEFLTLENPNASSNTATVQYFLGSGAPLTKQYTLAANSRTTLVVNQEVGANQSVSIVVTGSLPLVAERPMYFTYTGLAGFTIPGGTDVLGATQLGQQFDFGYINTLNSTTVGNDPYLTFLNPNSSPMNVTIDYFAAAGGAPIVRTHSFAANSRGTVNIRTQENLPQGSYSALVSLDVPGLVERPYYLKDAVTGYTGAADVVGVSTPQTDWYFAEGYTNTNFSERYYLSNPNPSQSASATVTFFLSNGTTQSTTVSIPAGGQVMVDANALLGNNVNNSAHVSASLPILAERFMSFSFPGATAIPGATDVLGTNTPSNLFYFAEGYTGAGFDEYLTIENPSATQTATVTVTFYPDTGGAPTVQVYTIAPSSRFTLFTANVLPNASFSMQVVSNVAIVAERPMYFNFTNSGQTGGTDIVGYQP
jgi:hypothetical protein